MTSTRLSREYSTKMNFDFFEICITDEILEDSDLLDSFLFDCQCALFLIDITDKESFNQIKKLVDKVDFSEYSYLKIIILENKIDKESDRVINNEEIDSFMKDNNIEDKMKISLKDGTGFEELVEKMNSFTNNKENDIPINFFAQENSQRPDANLNLEKTITIILIGDSNVGKTCFFTRFNKNEFKESFLSTIGMDKYIKYYKYKDEECKIIIWDTAGQDRYKSLPKKYYQNADGIFIFFDVTNKESFNDVSVWMNEINNNTRFEEVEGDNKENNENKIVVYLVGNKIDKLKRCVSKEEAEEKASFYGIKYFEISCKINMNISEVSTRMINDCIIKFEERKEEKEEIRMDSFTLRNVKKNKDAHKNKGCC
jgi:small GTP-binding protein